METLFGGASTVRARALYVGERIDLRTFETTARLSPQAPLCIAAGERGIAVLFRYGAIVLFHINPLEEVALLDGVKRYVGEPLARPEIEETEVRLSPETQDGVEGTVIRLAEFKIERVQIIAEILARSVALARYEAIVRESFAVIEPWAQALQQRGGSTGLEEQLLKNLGASLLIQHAMATRIEIDDKPELLWERADLERIYARLEDEYELKERDNALDRKLALMSSTSEMLLNLVNNRHGRRLEWYVIGLILFEIVISLVQWGIGFGGH